MGLEQLLEQVRSGAREARIQAVGELANLREPRAVDALVEALGDDDWDLQIAAASALAQIGDPRAVKPVFELMESWSWLPDRGVALARTVLQFKEAAIRPITKMRSPEGSAAKECFLVALGAEVLIAMITGSRDAVQRKVAYAFGGVADLRVVEPLVAKLFSWPRGSIQYALGRLGDARAVEPLITTLQKDDFYVRSAAASALGMIGDARAVGPLIAALERDRDWSAARALGEIGDARALTSLMRAAREEGDAAQEAVKALAKFGSAGVEPLLTLLRDEQSWIRSEAAECLGGIGDPRAIEPLRLALREEDLGVREKAARALQLLHWHPENAVDRAWYSVAQSRWTDAVNAGEEAVDPLVAALGHPDSSVRRQAAEALGVLGDARAVEPLRRLAERDRDAHVHRAATEALLATEALVATQALNSPQSQAHREPTEREGAHSRRFPLDVLLISGHMHAGASTSRGLHMHLSRHPAVRSYGISNDKEQVMGYLQSGLVNTIFIDPCFPGECWYGDIELFIREVRTEFPNIVFVLYTDPDCLERFCKVHPRFRHYFYLDKIEDGAPASAVIKNATTRAVDDVLQRCEEWHSTRYQYDVGISFAGEDRQYAEEIADQLRVMGARIFYDAYEEADLLGKNLYTHLHGVYTEKCRYCVILISQAYAKKAWTSHERVAAQERALQERDREYILPVRIDNTTLPGLSNVIAYVRIDRGTSNIADLISRKLWTDPNAPKYYIGESLY